jgi:hypothetical protein
MSGLVGDRASAVLFSGPQASWGALQDPSVSLVDQRERLAPPIISLSVAEEAEDPACVPIFWVSKWVDYSDKYGLGMFLPE